MFSVMMFNSFVVGQTLVFIQILAPGLSLLSIMTKAVPRVKWDDVLGDVGGDEKRAKTVYRSVYFLTSVVFIMVLVVSSCSWLTVFYNTQMRP